jgi:predicted nucleotidyltransferase
MEPITDELIQEIKNRIISEVHPEKIILFGSYAYGTPTKDSDLDLLVIMASHEPMHKRIFRIRKLLRDFRVPKDVIVYTPQEVDNWKNVSNAFITSIIRKGKVIYGL